MLCIMLLHSTGIHIICKGWCRAVIRRALLVIEAVWFVEWGLNSETDDDDQHASWLSWNSTFFIRKMGILTPLSSKSFFSHYLFKGLGVSRIIEQNSWPQGVFFSFSLETFSLETSSKPGHWDKGECRKTMDLEVENELLAQDSPLRQHKHKKGNDREEIIGCYFYKPQILFLHIISPMPWGLPHQPRSCTEQKFVCWS